jgi:RTA1 like protein
MELGRIISMLQAEKHSMLRTKWLTGIFVTGDVLSFLMQASGMFLYYQLSGIVLLTEIFRCWSYD